MIYPRFHWGAYLTLELRFIQKRRIDVETRDTIAAALDIRCMEEAPPLRTCKMRRTSYIGIWCGPRKVLVPVRLSESDGMIRLIVPQAFRPQINLPMALPFPDASRPVTGQLAPGLAEFFFLLFERACELQDPLGLVTATVSDDAWGGPYMPAGARGFLIPAYVASAVGIRHPPSRFGSRDLVTLPLSRDAWSAGTIPRRGLPY